MSSRPRVSVFKRRWSALLLCALGACTAGTSTTRTDSRDILELTVGVREMRQTIHSFGAADAWGVQFVGNWPDEKRRRVADLLFSLEQNVDGSPTGIGLSAWRFNIGGGSAEQDSASGIPDRWRRAESFLGADGRYDWNKQSGERWFLRAAKARGVEQFIGFVNSPPVHFTRNGKALSSGGAATNLARDRFDDFARFLRDVVVNVGRNDGVHFDYLSPVNEPQWDWTARQEGTPWLNAELKDFVVELNTVLREANLETKVQVPEAGKLTYLFTDADKPGRGTQLAFFDRNSSLFIGDLSHVDKTLVGHSYFTTHPTDTLLSTRRELRERMRRLDPSLELWMSEYCVLENNSEIRGGRRDLGMNTALYVAKVIHADLSVAEANAWHWWLAVSPYNYKDGLIYVDQNVTDGAVHESKTLWALGHYSRFVRPGMRRVEVGRSDGRDAATMVDGALTSAYRDPATGQTVVVVVNRDTTPVPMRMRADGVPRWRSYLTSAEPRDNLRFTGERDAREVVVVPPRSLMTFVGGGRGRREDGGNSRSLHPPPHF